MRIVIADDHDLMRRGIRDLVSACDDWVVVGEASRGDDAVRQIDELQPDVAILDFSMPILSGPEVALAVASTAPGTRIVVLTMHDSETTLRAIVECGAHGYVLKSEADIYLRQALQAVLVGDRYYHSRALEMMRTGYLNRQTDAEIGDKLTQRERGIVVLLAMGLSSKEAAANLEISTRTVETHRMNIYRKLRVNTIAALVRYAIRENLVSTF
ncbi:response regulator [Terriglobus roseus]|uniref:Two component transcriptional regulator, LuxR family n=1 Tax=Terriglobus roseus TaxID=392734 RepID=A0A1H4J9R7_9BACT|nr:response regulator transcription factor [Terriglobus roseus]SEB42907.1 two component transcriptional regulator, LuxR family [Terriglobus roseus]